MTSSHVTELVIALSSNLCKVFLSLKQNLRLNFTLIFQLNFSLKLTVNNIIFVKEKNCIQQESCKSVSLADYILTSECIRTIDLFFDVS